jgi:hypothetical protein
MRRAATGLGCLLGVVLLYRLVLRQPLLTWGATQDEANGSLPGDELLLQADLVSTRAVSISAPPSAVWPWLVQMGQGRGGAYTYDWIENLFGLDMHSADRIVAAWQHLDVGDTIGVKPDGSGLQVARLDDERVLASRSEDGTWVWSFVLEPRGAGTRLVSRNRFSTKDLSPVARLVLLALTEPGSWVMERKMLLGIKERAERLHRGA